MFLLSGNRRAEKAPELAAGRVKRFLLILGVAVIKERAAVLDHREEDPVHGLLSQRRIVVEVANELASQRPHVVDMFLDGPRR